MVPINDHRNDGSVDLDQMFEALANTMRRRILVSIMEENPRSKDEFRTPEFGAEDADEDKVNVELCHVHLPQLDEAGFIEWDRSTGDVTRGDDFDEIRPIIELLDEHQEVLPVGSP